MESRWRLPVFRRESSGKDAHSKFRISRSRSQSVDKVSGARTAAESVDGDSEFEFTRDWIDMPVSTQRRSADGSCIHRTKSQSSIYNAEQTADGPDRPSRGRKQQGQEHSGRVIKWLRNSLRRSRSRSNSRQDKHGKVSESSAAVNSIDCETGKYEPRSMRGEVLMEPVSQVQNKVELFERKTTPGTACPESLQVTQNLKRYSFIKAQQGNNEQVLSAHQAALSGQGVIQSAKDSKVRRDTGVGNRQDGARTLVGMSSRLLQPGTSDVSNARGGRVDKSVPQLRTGGSTGPSGQGDVPTISTGLRSALSGRTPSRHQHVDWSTNTCSGSSRDPPAQTSSQGQVLSAAGGITIGRLAQHSNVSYAGHKIPVSISGTHEAPDAGHTRRRAAHERTPAAREAFHDGSRHQNHVTHAQVHHQSHCHLASNISGDRTNVHRRYSINDPVPVSQREYTPQSRTAQGSDEFQHLDADYRRQLNNFGQNYPSTAREPLQNLHRHSALCVDERLQEPVPLETHFGWKREYSSSHPEVMVSCKEAIQKASTVITKAATRPQTPDEVGSKNKAPEQLSRGGSPASDLSRGESGSSSDISGSHAIISKIENVGTHSSYFRVSDITCSVTKGKKGASEPAAEVGKGDKGNDSSVWNESGSEHLPTAGPSEPLGTSTPCETKMPRQKDQGLYQGNWEQLASSPSLPSEPNKRSVSLSSEMCASSLTETSTLDWNSGSDAAASVEFPGGRASLVHRSSVSSLNRYASPTGAPVTSDGRVADEGVVFKHFPKSTAVSKQAKARLRVASESTSSEDRSCDLLRKSDLMDESMKTKDLNVTAASKDETSNSKAHFEKKISKSHHNLHHEKILARKNKDNDEKQEESTQNLWRSQSQPNVNQENPLLQKRLEHQLGGCESDDSVSSEWSSSSSLDGGRIGDVVEAKIRSRKRRKYRVNSRSRQSRSQGHLAARSRSNSRSLSRSQSRDRSLDGIIRPEKNFILERWWATLGDIPATLEEEECAEGHAKKGKHKKHSRNGKLELAYCVTATQCSCVQLQMFKINGGVCRLAVSVHLNGMHLCWRVWILRLHSARPLDFRDISDI